MRSLLGGGDDYEILMTMPPSQAASARQIGDRLGVPLTVIGRIVASSGVTILDGSGAVIDLTQPGYQHF